jgi:SAM-dependent methyltransferase
MLAALKSVLAPAAHWVDLQWSLTIEQLQRVAPRARGRLLDVGCGSKPYAAIFTPHVDEYVGLERRGSFELTAAAASGAPDVYYDGGRMPFEDESFDTILCIQVIEHTPEPQALLEEIARVLRPGGLLVLSAPFAFRLHEEPHDYFRYTPFGLDAICRQVGLTIEETWAQGSLWSVLGHSLNSFLAFRVAALEGVLQGLGKLTHESEASHAPKLWRAPLVVPAMFAVSAGARTLERLVPDRSMALGFQVIVRKPERA